MSRSSISSSNPWRRFSLWILGVFIMLMGMVILLSLLSLYNTKEYWSDQQIIAHQQKNTHILMRTAIEDLAVSPSHKMARYDLIKPEIIALGSSRVLQWRENHFTKPFVNMGVSIELEKMPQLARELVENPHHLKLVLLGIDFWSFQDQPTRTFKNFKARQPDQKRYKNMIKNIIRAPANWIMDQTMTLSDLFLLAQNKSPATRTPIRQIGIAATMDQSGISLDGSYHDQWVFDPQKPPKNGFEMTLNRIKTGTKGFESNNKISAQHWEILQQTIDILEDAGVIVIPFIPPVAPQVADAMHKTNQYQAIDQLAARQILNYHDPRPIGSEDCEFLDGFHGGETTYARLLRDLANRKSLQPWVNMPEINHIIQTRAGFAQAKSLSLLPNWQKERDFLQLDCNK